MVSCWVIYVVLAYVVVLATGLNSTYRVPEVKFEVLRNGGFRAYWLAPENAKRCNILININTPVGVYGIPRFQCETYTRHNGYFVVESKYRVNKDDILYYEAYEDGLRRSTSEGTIFFWRVEELLRYYTITETERAEECKEVLFYDGFHTNSINTDNWIVEHKIPTYTGPRFVFNSYLNTPETVFISNHVLHLKPIALTNEDDVRGSLDLGSRCTSYIHEECVFTQQSTFLLPPVKSAMLRSRRKFRYGSFLIDAQLPVGDWIFPIIQLARPTTDHVSVDELWIAFIRGNQAYLETNIDGDSKTQVLFAGPVDNADEPLRSKKLVSCNSTDAFSSSFSKYKLNWYPDKLEFFVDGELCGELNSQLGSFGTSGSNLEYELQIGVGIGGLIDFPDGYNYKPWNNSDRNYMKKFFEDRVNWLKTWNGNDTALKIRSVNVTAQDYDL